MGNSQRLMILCHLLEGEKLTGALERAVSLRQSALSQHMAKLRGNGPVRAWRVEQAVYYALAGSGPSEVIDVLHKLCCSCNTRRRSWSARN